MENLGYKEGFAKTKKMPRKMSRALSVVGEDETAPLSMSRLKPGSIKRSRPAPETIIEESYPSDGFEYMEAGPTPAADEIAPNMYASFEEPTAELSVRICDETIRSNLVEQMRSLGFNGHLKILEDIEEGNISTENVIETFAKSIKLEKNVAFLWAAYLKRWDLLEPIVSCGADVNYCDSNGYTALHLAAFSGCLGSISILLDRGMEVNSHTKCHSPLHFAAFGRSPEVAKMLISNGAKISNTSYVGNGPASQQSSDESLLHCAVRATALDCLRLFIEEGADVNALWSNGTNAIHLAADLGSADCLEILLNAPKADPNIKIGLIEKESTALHLAADEGNAACVNLLLGKGADATVKNHRGYTPLHLASRTCSLECVDLLLQGGADPNAEDFDQRTPIHAAIGKSDNTLDILETLIAWGGDVNLKDTYGFTSLHLAALEGIAHCVELLIFHEADVTTKTKKGATALGVIARKTPASMAMVSQKMDEAIILTQSQDSNREIEVELDFRALLQHCHPREISYLNTFVDEGQKEILQHPLCTAFLYIKWRKIRKYFIVRLVFCFTFVLFLTLYVLTALAHNCYNGSKDMEETTQEQELCQKQSILGDMLRINPFVMEMQWWVLVAITLVEVFRKLYGLTGYSSFKRYFTQPENIIEWFVICSVFIISYVWTNRTYTWQNHVGAFAVLVSWTNLMLMVGQLPALGVYVAMYTKVQAQFAKLFAAFFCLLIGFTISFCVIFPDSSMFSNPFMGFISVLIMMTGELDVELLINDPDGKDPPVLLEISAQITFVLFMLFVTVVLMNLLVGIAVDDIQGLKKTADLSKLERQTKLISYIESALFNGWLPKWLRSLLHHTALVSPEACRVVLSVRPLNPGEKRLPRDILNAAYETAKSRKSFAHTVTAKNSSVNYFSYKEKLENNSATALGDKSGDSDCGFEDDGMSTLTNKVEESVDKVDQLTFEVKELKVSMHHNQKVMDQLLIALANQPKQAIKKSTEPIDIRRF